MQRSSPSLNPCSRQRDTRLSALSTTWMLHLGLSCAFSLLLLGCHRGSSQPSAQVEIPDAPAGLENAGPLQAESAEVVDVKKSDQVEDPLELNDNQAKSAASQVLEADPRAEWMSGSWTTQRLLALSPGGPTLIDLSVNVDGKSLEQATTDATQAIASELFEGLMQDKAQLFTWTELLAHPLVKSGWLGNLVAAEEQASQLVGMYDTQRDDLVTLAELAPFLSRGLARNDPLQISDIGNAPNAEVNQSPWGPADQDSDQTLDEQEISVFASVIGELDYNGDSILSVQELRQEQDMQTPMQGMGRTSLLETNTLVVATGVSADDVEEANKARRRLSSRILDHYTFLEGIPRAQWSRWNDERWQLLDTNHDGLLVRAELEKLSSIPSDIRLMVRFPSLESTQDAVRAYALPLEEPPVPGMAKAGASADMHTASSTWHDSSTGGQMRVAGLIAQVQIQDAFSIENRRQLKQLFENALTNPQLQTFVTSQFQLQEGAFDLLDTDQDKSLSDEEFARVWRWLTARQGTRLIVRWMVAANPWFSLWDRNGDERLTAIETRQSPEFFQALDENHDGRLVPNELPLVVRMEFERADSRLATPLGLGNASPMVPEDADWFAAMDTNRDGYIAQAEFLGEFEDFATLDSSKDGFLSRAEVYRPNGKH